MSPSLNYIAPLVSKKQMIAFKNKNRIRIGFISSYLFDHSIGKILFEVIYFLARNHPEFEVFVFLVGGTMGNDRDDSITSAFLKVLGPEHFIRLSSSYSVIRR
jgi:predicted O-linked N-acetylglucosamine transferase (SPINDLY family)